MTTTAAISAITRATAVFSGAAGTRVGTADAALAAFFAFDYVSNSTACDQNYNRNYNKINRSHN